MEGYGPAQLIAYPQRGLGHFCHDHWEERRPRLTLRLVRDTRHSLAAVRRELGSPLEGGNQAGPGDLGPQGICRQDGGPLTICLLQPGQVPIMDELVASSSLFPCG